jgi:hypothetical protein
MTSFSAVTVIARFPSSGSDDGDDEVAEAKPVRTYG